MRKLEYKGRGIFRSAESFLRSGLAWLPLILWGMIFGLHAQVAALAAGIFVVMPESLPQEPRSGGNIAFNRKRIVAPPTSPAARCGISQSQGRGTGIL